MFYVDLEFNRKSANAKPDLGWYVDETTEPGVPLMKALIKEIRDEAYRNNAVLLVGVIPSPFQVYPDVYDHMLKGTYAGNKAVASYLKEPRKTTANYI